MITSWNANAIAQRARQAVGRGLATGIGIVETRAVELITTGEKTGRIYRRRGVEHQASAPGEAPASDSGRLVQSREVKVDVEGGRATLSFHTEYAWWLEIGTEKMEARPFADRSLAESRRGVFNAVASELSTEFKR